MTRPAVEIAAELRRVAFILEELDDGAALPPLYVTVGVQVTVDTVPSEAARMALVDRIAGALGLDASLSDPQFAHYRAFGEAVDVYTPAPLAAAEATVLAAREGTA